MQRLPQIVLIVSTLLGSWLGMQAIHEAGHVLGARLTSGTVERVVLHPLTISRTDLAENPNPLLVVWAGPLFGVTAPVLGWVLGIATRFPAAFILRFFAGFCLIANGLYIGIGSFDGVGDCGQMLRTGSPIIHLWLFGLVTAPLGLFLWHGQGTHFGLGLANGRVNHIIAFGSLGVTIGLFVMGCFFGD